MVLARLLPKRLPALRLIEYRPRPILQHPRRDVVGDLRAFAKIRYRFGDDGTKATRFYKPADSDDRRNENDEDIVHPGIVSKSQKPAEFRPIL
jgi:hypothetical protein